MPATLEQVQRQYLLGSKKPGPKAKIVSPGQIFYDAWRGILKDQGVSYEALSDTSKKGFEKGASAVILEVIKQWTEQARQKFFYQAYPEYEDKEILPKYTLTEPR